MGSRRRRIACLLVAASLTSPAAALAQSAGDEQYEDPFGSGGQEQPEPTPAPETPVTPDDGVAQPAPAPAPTAAAAQPSPTTQEQLPRTGADERLVALVGVIVLAGGIALRVRLR